MGKVCIACGMAPATPEPQIPPKKKTPPEPEKCPNCGKEGSMKEEKEEEEDEE